LEHRRREVLHFNVTEHPTAAWTSQMIAEREAPRYLLRDRDGVYGNEVRLRIASFFAYYHRSRTHLGLKKECPFPRPVSSIGKITEIPQLGGLHHRYERLAA
jgi:hypothetical protein